MYTINDDRVVMQVNGLKAAFHMPPATLPKFERKDGKEWHPKDGEDAKGDEIIQGLPPGAPRFVFPVDEYKCPASWMNGSSKGSSYWLPVRAGCGMWLDLNYNFGHSHHVAAVVSIQGINPITGQQTKKLRLEQYRDRCPVHDTPFGQDRFCEECNFKWDAQNYVCSNATPKGLLWIDGFRHGDGVVRQYVFTKETCKGVAAQIAGDERVFAIGIAFYLSKKPKADIALPLELRPVETYSESALKGFPPSSSISPSVKTGGDIATFKRISIPLERKRKELSSSPGNWMTMKDDGFPKDDAQSMHQKAAGDASYPDLNNPYVPKGQHTNSAPRGGVLHDQHKLPDSINFGPPPELKVEFGQIPSEIKCSMPTLENLKMDALAQNPQLLGVAAPCPSKVDVQIPPLVMPCVETGGAACAASTTDFDSGEEYSSESIEVLTPIAPGENLTPADIDGSLREKSPEEIEHEMEKLEITAGARIRQRIYMDPESPDFWQDEPAGFIYINYVDLETAEKIMAAGRRERSGSFLAALGGM